MNQIPKVSAGDALAIRARDWNALADIANGVVVSGRPGLNGSQSISVLVRNDTGGDLARYRCVTLSDPVYELESNGSVDLIFKAIAADATKTPAILSEIIATGKFGRAWIHGLAYAWVGPGTTTLRDANPTSSSNRLTPASGGIVRLLGAPSASVEKVLPVLLGAGGTTFKIYKYTLTADMGTSATANLTEPGGSATESGVTLNDTIGLAAWQVTGGVGLCYKGANGQYYVIVPECEPEEISGSGA